MLIVGLPFTVPMEDSCLLSSLPWREDVWRRHLELGMKIGAVGYFSYLFGEHPKLVIRVNNY